MGMIMNRFNMLTQIRKDIKKDKDLGINLNQFILSGIIVHDTNDLELIDCISKHFVEWAEMTGDHFLFITFVRPSEDWKKSKFCHDAYWIDKNNLMADSKNAEDEERTIPLLRNFLGLPKSGSYLMATNDLSSNDFHKIPITSNTIVSQLQLLTNYCNKEASGEEHSPADFKRLLRTLKADDYVLNTSLLDIMIDFASITSKLVDNKERETQLKHADKVIDNLRSYLKVYEGTDYEERLFNLCEAIVIVFNKFSNTDKFLLRPELRNLFSEESSSKKYMDEYSNKLLYTYRLLSSIFIGSKEPLDYSGLTIYLGKIVENELHLSVGQMIRWSMGIEMPKYFNKYCKFRRVIVQTGQQTIDLNKSIFKGCSRLKSVPIGPLMIAYNTVINYPWNIDPIPNSDRLHRLDRKLVEFIDYYRSKYRNPAGHLDPDSIITYEGAKNAFQTFLTDYLIQLYKIRIELSRPKGCRI